MLTHSKKRYETPRTCDELVDLLMSDLTTEHLDVLAHMTDAEFEWFYDEVAVQIIDEFDLWTGNSRLLRSCLLSAGRDGEEAEPARIVLKRMREQVREETGLIIIT